MDPTHRISAPLTPVPDSSEQAVVQAKILLESVVASTNIEFLEFTALELRTCLPHRQNETKRLCRLMNTLGNCCPSWVTESFLRSETIESAMKRAIEVSEINIRMISARKVKSRVSSDAGIC